MAFIGEIQCLLDFNESKANTGRRGTGRRKLDSRMFKRTIPSNGPTAHFSFFFRSPHFCAILSIFTKDHNRDQPSSSSSVRSEGSHKTSLLQRSSHCRTHP